MSGNKGQVGGTNLSGAKNVTITNSGVSPDLLTQLVGSLTQNQTQPAPVDYSAPPSSSIAPPAPVIDTSGGADTGTTIPKSYWVIGSIAAVLVLLFILKKIKL